MTARVPTVYRSSGPGCSFWLFFCVTRMRFLSSVARTASTAATELGRPTDSGMNRYGNSTVFLSGRTGRVTTVSVSGVTSGPP